MTEGCAANPSVTRNSHAAILRALAALGQKPVADALGKSETWVSRWKSEDSETCAALLAALGLKCVPAGHKCYDAGYIDHLRYFAKIGMEHEEPPLKLDWDRGQDE